MFEVICPNCNQPRQLKDKRGAEGRLCRKCLEGPTSPTWKGGHSHWTQGRYGRDKNGLSWKVQRRLAWERDNYECQHCHQRKKRNPDVHHIEPWMNSHSHALENLLCLCQSCHLKEEAKVQLQWGGEHFHSPKPKTRPRCNGCGAPLQKNFSREFCKKCKTSQFSVIARELRNEGLGYKQIADRMGVTTMTAYYYVNGRKRKP